MAQGLVGCRERPGWISHARPEPVQGFDKAPPAAIGEGELEEQDGKQRVGRGALLGGYSHNPSERGVG